LSFKEEKTIIVDNKGRKIGTEETTPKKQNKTFAYIPLMQCCTLLFSAKIRKGALKKG
jgi:hypothetical protein